MALRLFRLQREPQPGSTPGPASALAAPEPTRIALDAPAPPRVVRAKAGARAKPGKNTRAAKKAKPPRASKKR